MDSSEDIDNIVHMSQTENKQKRNITQKTKKMWNTDNGQTIRTNTWVFSLFLLKSNVTWS
jgi:hypothetical protein